jgi:hypothetical protein
MKNMLIAIVALSSLSAFAAETCLITSDFAFEPLDVQCSNASDRKAPWETNSGVAGGIKEAIKLGYKVHLATSTGRGVQYLLIKD